MANRRNNRSNRGTTGRGGNINATTVNPGWRMPMAIEDEEETEPVSPLHRKRVRNESTTGGSSGEPSAGPSAPSSRTPAVNVTLSRNSSPSQMLNQIGSMASQLLPSDELLGYDMNRNWINDWIRLFKTTTVMANSYDSSFRQYIENTKDEVVTLRSEGQKKDARIAELEDENRRLRAAKFPGGNGKLVEDIDELKLMNASFESRIDDLNRQLEHCKNEVKQLEAEKTSALESVALEEKKSKALIVEALAQSDRAVADERARAKAEIEEVRRRRSEQTRQIVKCTQDELSTKYAKRLKKFREYFKAQEELKDVDSKRIQAWGTRDCLDKLIENGLFVPDDMLSVLDEMVKDFSAQTEALKSKLPTIEDSDFEMIIMSSESSLSSDPPRL